MAKLKERIARAMQVLAGRELDPGTHNALVAAGVALEEDVQGEELPFVAFSRTAGDDEAQKALAETQKQLAEERAKNLGRDADAWAGEVIAAGKAFPAEKPALVAQFGQAAQDDAAHAATVTFGEGDKAFSGGRVDALKALYAARPAHGLTEEHLKALAEGKVLMGKDKDTLNDERRKQLLGMTPLGQSVLTNKGS